MALASSLLLLLLAVVAPAVHGVDHTVGGTNGWSQSADLATWAAGETFTVGDNLLFSYSSMHGLNIVSKDTYDKCTSGIALKTFSNGQDTVPLLKAGPMYFICPVSGHCDSGMKLAITVVDTTTTKPPATTTPSGNTSPSIVPPSPGSSSDGSSNTTTKPPATTTPSGNTSPSIVPPSSGSSSEGSSNTTTKPPATTTPSGNMSPSIVPPSSGSSSEGSSNTTTKPPATTTPSGNTSPSIVPPSSDSSSDGSSDTPTPSTLSPKSDHSEGHFCNFNRSMVGFTLVVAVLFSFMG